MNGDDSLEAQAFKRIYEYVINNVNGVTVKPWGPMKLGVYVITSNNNLFNRMWYRIDTPDDNRRADGIQQILTSMMRTIKGRCPVASWGDLMITLCSDPEILKKMSFV